MHELRSARPGAWRQGSGQHSAAVVSGHKHSTTFRTQQGRVVGRLSAGWLTKRVISWKHQLRQPRAWACDADHLALLGEMGCQGVRLLDEKDVLWSATLEQFHEHGIPLDRGFGPQVALPLAHWHVRPASQLSLWEVS